MNVEIESESEGEDKREGRTKCRLAYKQEAQPTDHDTTTFHQSKGEETIGNKPRSLSGQGGKGGGGRINETPDDKNRNRLMLDIGWTLDPY